MDTYCWWRDGVIYQIYPRSFSDSNSDGIGDLNGIIARLDYLAELGVDALWLSPVNPSPDVDFGYDVSDYNDIDPKFGTLADFDRLLEEAHRRNIRIILDLVLNHTSNQHPWFLQSSQSRENPYRDWYIWRDPSPDGKTPNRWESIFGGRAWEYHSATGQYYYHMFYPQQPDLNWRHPPVRQAMLDVFRFWLERGVDGFRLDVFNMYFKDADFRDNPPALGLRGFDRQKHIYDCNQPEMQGILTEIRALLNQYPDRYAVGETFMAAGAQDAARYTGETQLHATFNFDFLFSPWKPARFLQAIQTWDQALGVNDWPTYVLNNHDQPRSATRYARGADDERLKVAATLLLTQRGTPYLYYGEEIGQRDIRLRRDQIMDPVGKRYWPFNKGRDACRAPMQWDAAAHAGFSAAEPWLPPHPDYPTRNVVAQRGDPNSLLNFYKQLIALRKKYAALRSGLFQPITFEPRAVLGYLRETSDQTALVALNFSRRPQRLMLGGSLAKKSWQLLLSNRREKLDETRFSSIALAPDEACILLQY